MSVEQALARLGRAEALLTRERTGRGYAVYPRGDRRRRPLARIGAEDVRALLSAGALAPGAEADTYVLSTAGEARARRDAAAPKEQFLAQHARVGERRTLAPEGVERVLRGLEARTVLKRLAALRDSRGGPWLSAGELRAAHQIVADWEASQGGLIRGSDWGAAPMGSAARGPSNTQERKLAARCDARRRIGEALESLAPPLRRVVERVCLLEEGLEALERSEGWPARSGKIALKLGLAQVAMRL